MRWLCVCLLAACSAPVIEEAPAVAGRTYSAGDYADCAACHLADGGGVPGVFPPLRNRCAQMASLDGGREYLVAVVSWGLMGRIQAGGTAYAGVMPGYRDAMGADAIAATLNYLVFDLNDDHEGKAQIDAFTGDEVRGLQAGTSGGGPTAAARLRERLLQRHGDSWPR